ncbi:hypothetical protein V2J09_020205 [Rumex salicifolius]
MATVAADLPIDAPAKKGKGGRKALKQKNATTNESNTLPVGDISGEVQKENHESLSQPRSVRNKPKSTKSKSSKQAAETNNPSTITTNSFEKEMSDLQEMLEKMKIEKEKAEDLLKEKDEMLRMKEEELENKDKAQEKLQVELKKLQKMKEFKPDMTLPVIQSLLEKDLDKKDKKKGGPEKVKKPAPPYVLWCKDQWNEVKKANPDADFKEVSVILGAKWKTISPEVKKPYEEKYQAEKEAYLRIVSKEKRENEAMKLLGEEQKQKTAMELLEQYLQFKQEAEKETKKTKKEKDPLKPKQPMSAFFVYSNERRFHLLGEGKGILEVSKIAGEEWKNMTEEQKKPYEERAKENKEKYQQEMEVYKQMKEEEEANMKREEEEHMKLQKVEALQLLKKKEKTENIIKKAKDQKKKQPKEEKNNDPSKPKRPLSSYFLFSKEVRKSLVEEHPDINNSTVTGLLSAKWKELGDEEKQIWNKKAAEAMEAYKKEMEEYNKTAAEGKN